MEHAQAMQIYDKTVAALLADLDRLGVKYKAEDRHGQSFTNIKVTRKKKFSFRSLNITKKIQAASPGDTVDFDAGKLPLGNLQSSVTAQANKLLGSGRYNTVQDATNNRVRLFITGSPVSHSIDEVMKTLEGALL